MDQHPLLIACHIEPVQSVLHASDLFPEEQQYIDASHDKRQREFCAGRVALRRALAHVGANAQALMPREGKRYVVIPGHTVSIAHTDTLAVAIASADPRILSLGIDIEDTRREVLPSLRDRVCLDDNDGQGMSPLEVFCIKEASYKALSPLIGDISLSFNHARIECNNKNEYKKLFQVIIVENRVQEALQSLSGTEMQHGVQLRGRLVYVQEHIIAHVEVRNGLFTAGALQF